MAGYKKINVATAFGIVLYGILDQWRRLGLLPTETNP